MANRAYLFSFDEIDEIPDWRLSARAKYYDSRWSIPLAWFFFFQPGDVKMLQVKRRSESWEEPKLVTVRESALKTFASRQGALLAVADGRVTSGLLDRLANDVATWPGKLLVLDPCEILMGVGESDDWHYAKIESILQLLSTEGVTPDEIRSETALYWHPETKYDGQDAGNFIGFTYS
jgi:hypothetical protein